ncbi:SGNH/GDSL hydrolase family protein [Thalassolituus sp.]|uniref:SGNH/GDSL hydrolase family protein n=1 Tax=Thalassolituus sp. TaxID=2030822 RepID=UPI003513DFDE
MPTEINIAPLLNLTLDQFCVAARRAWAEHAGTNKPPYLSAQVNGTTVTLNINDESAAGSYAIYQGGLKIDTITGNVKQVTGLAENTAYSFTAVPVVNETELTEATSNTVSELTGTQSSYVETFVAYGQQAYRANSNFSTSNKQLMAQTVFTVEETQTHLRLAFDNAYNYTGSSGDAAKSPAPGSATISASVVDAAGNFTRVTFSGSNDAVIAAGGAVVSDEVELTAPIAPGSTHFVRVYYRSADGIVYGDKVITGVGNRMEFSTTTVTDKTMSGTIVGTDGFCFPPFAIIGRQTGSNRSVMALGDSICWGTEDQEERTDAAYGIISRSLYGFNPNVIMGRPGGRVENFLVDRSNIGIVDDYVDVVISNFGTNDLNSRTVQQLFDDLTSLRNSAAYADKDFYILTLIPRTDSGNVPNLVTPKIADFNSRLRSGEFDSVFTGYFDVAAVLEDSAAPGTWDDETDTNDYIHPNQKGYDKIAASGVIVL